MKLFKVRMAFESKDKVRMAFESKDKSKDYVKLIPFESNFINKQTLRKKCRYSELFQSVLSPNAGKSGPE